MAGELNHGVRVGSVRLLIATEPRDDLGRGAAEFGLGLLSGGWGQPTWWVLSATDEETGEVKGRTRFKGSWGANRARKHLVAEANRRSDELEAGTFQWQFAMNRARRMRFRPVPRV